MDQRQAFELVMQLQSVLPPIHQNNRAQAALSALREMLTVQEEPFVYSAEFTGALNTTLAAGGGQGTFNINIQKDANFRILAACYEADIAGAPQVDATRQLALVTVLLTDTGSGRAFMDRPVPIPSMFGDGRLPFQWPVPKVMKALSTLQVQVTNFCTVNDIDLRLAFIGIKEYSFS